MFLLFPLLRLRLIASLYRPLSNFAPVRMTDATSKSTARTRADNLQERHEKSQETRVSNERRWLHDCELVVTIVSQWQHFGRQR